MSLLGFVINLSSLDLWPAFDADMCGKYRGSIFDGGTKPLGLSSVKIKNFLGI